MKPECPGPDGLVDKAQDVYRVLLFPDCLMNGTDKQPTVTTLVILTRCRLYVNPAGF